MTKINNGTNESEETWQKKMDRTDRWKKKCLFYRKQFGSKMCMRHEHMESGSHRPMCSNYRAVKKYRDRGESKLGRAAHERGDDDDDDAQPAAGFCVVQVKI